jgi:mersacidin/lichenicidin family type 2 lantibiotic
MAIDVARAWKDPEYRKTLTPEELASLPEKAAGEISDEGIQGVSGGAIIVDIEKAAVKFVEKVADAITTAIDRAQPR